MGNLMYNERYYTGEELRQTTSIFVDMGAVKWPNGPIGQWPQFFRLSGAAQRHVLHEKPTTASPPPVTTSSK